MICKKCGNQIADNLAMCPICGENLRVGQQNVNEGVATPQAVPAEMPSANLAPTPEPAVSNPAPVPEPAVSNPAPAPEPAVSNPAPAPEPAVSNPAPAPEPAVSNPIPTPQPADPVPPVMPEQNPTPQMETPNMGMPMSNMASPAPAPQPMNNNPQPKKSGSGFIIIIVILIAVAGVLGYLLLSGKMGNSSEEPNNTTEAVPTTQATQPTTSQVISSNETFEHKGYTYTLESGYSVYEKSTDYIQLIDKTNKVMIELVGPEPYSYSQYSSAINDLKNELISKGLNVTNYYETTAATNKWIIFEITQENQKIYLGITSFKNVYASLAYIGTYGTKSITDICKDLEKMINSVTKEGNASFTVGNVEAGHNINIEPNVPNVFE